MVLKAYGSGGQTLGTYFLMDDAAVPAEWQEYQFRIGGNQWPLPAGTESIRVYGDLNQQGSTNRIRWGDVSLSDLSGVAASDTVTLQATTPQVSGLNYNWQQVLGPAVSLSNSSQRVATFVAPEQLEDTTLGFVVTVSDGTEIQSAYVDVKVNSLAIARINEIAGEVRNTILFEPAAGYMKNPEAVAATGRGNAWDIAAYLDSRIQEFDATVNTRLASGTIRAAEADVLELLGIDSIDAAVNVLTQAGLLKGHSVGSHVDFQHAWNEVELPNSQGNLEYVPLDAAWKSVIRAGGDTTWSFNFEDEFEPIQQQYSEDFSLRPATAAIPPELILFEGRPRIASLNSNPPGLYAENNGATLFFDSRQAVNGSARLKAELGELHLVARAVEHPNSVYNWTGFGLKANRSGNDVSIYLYKRGPGQNDGLGTAYVPYVAGASFEIRIERIGHVSHLVGRYNDVDVISRVIDDDLSDAGHFGFIAPTGSVVDEFAVDVQAMQDGYASDRVLHSLPATELPWAPPVIINSTEYVEPDYTYVVDNDNPKVERNSGWTTEETHSVKLELFDGTQLRHSVDLAVPDVARQEISLTAETNNVEWFLGNTSLYSQSGSIADLSLKIQHFDGFNNISTSAVADRSFEFDIPESGYTEVSLHAEQFAAADLAEMHATLAVESRNVPENNPHNGDFAESIRDTLALVNAQYNVQATQQLDVIDRATGSVSYTPFVTSGVVSSALSAEVKEYSVFYVVPDDLVIDQPTPAYLPVPMDGADTTSNNPEQKSRLQAALFTLSRLESDVVSAISLTPSISTATALSVSVAGGDTVYRLQKTGSQFVDQLSSTTFTETQLRDTLNHPAEFEDALVDLLDQSGTEFYVTVSADENALGDWSGSAYFYEDYTGTLPDLQSILTGDLTVHGGIASDQESLETPVDPDSLLVDEFSGATRRTDTDVVLPSVGPEFNLTRTWSSTEGRDLGFGVGWLNPFSESIVVQVINAGQTDVSTWVDATGSSYRFHEIGNENTWEPPRTLPKATLEYDPNIASTKVLTLGDGTTRTFVGNAILYLTEIKDRHGNVARIDRFDGNNEKIDKVTYVSPGGTEQLMFDFEYSNGNISKVTDHTNREWNYTYVTIDNKKYLQSVTGPESIETGGTSNITFEYTYQDAADLDSGRTALLKTARGITGIEQSYDWYRSGRLFQTGVTGEPVNTYFFDQFRHTTTVVDRVGLSSEFRFTSTGLLTEQIAADGGRVTNTWELESRLLESSTRMGYGTQSYEYSTDGYANLLKEVSPTGLETNYTYETDPTTNFHQPLTITADDPTEPNDDQVVTLLYYPNGDLKNSTDAESNIWQYSYYPNGLLSSEVNPRGNATIYTYNAVGLVETTTLPSEGANPPAIESATYFPNGNMESSTDESGITTEYTYDAYNRLLTTTVPDPYTGAEALGPLVSTTTYGTNGKVRSQTSATGDTALYEYDDVYSRLVRETHADGAFYEYTFNARGQITTATDEQGDVTRYVYDSAGRKTQVLHPDGGIGITIYDTAGRMLQTIDARGATNRFEYNAIGELVAEIDALGHETTHDYDAFGNRTETTDARQYTTTFGYDRLNRLVETNAAGIKLDIVEYDPNGNVTGEFSYDIQAVNPETTDLSTLPASKRRFATVEYDERDRPVKLTDAESNVIERTYDAAGRLASETNARGFTTNYEYDAAGLLHRTLQPAATAGGARPVETVWRDEAGRIVRTEDPNGGISRLEYNSRGQVTREIDALGHVTAFTYDAVGNLQTTRDALGRTTISVYDAMDRVVNSISAVVDADGPQVAEQQVVYDTIGNAIKSTDALGRLTEQQFDLLNRVTQITQVAPDTSVASRVVSQTYDAVGNLESQTDPRGNEISWIYNGLNQQVSELLPDPDGSGPLFATYNTASYDAFGNPLVSIVASGTSLAQRTDYEYDGLNRVKRELQPEVIDALTGNLARPEMSWTYDELGNVNTETDARGRVTTHVYDGLNRLISTEQPDPDPTDYNPQVVYFSYDVFGNRISSTDANGNVTRYEFDLNNRMVATYQPDAGQGLAVVESVYDAADRTVAAIDPLGHALVSEFDAFDRIVKQISPDPDHDGPALAAVTESEFDLVGNTTQTTDAAGHVTKMYYDYLNQNTIQILPDPDEDLVAGTNGPLVSAVLKTGYDVAGNVVTETLSFVGASAGEERVSTTTWDALNREVRMTAPDPDGSGPLPAPYSENTYDLAGNLVATSDHVGATANQLGRTTVFTYDALNRQTSAAAPHPLSGGQQAPTVTTYDLVGNVHSVTDPLGRTTTFEYDALDRLVTTTLPDPDLTDNFIHQTQQGWDANGNLTTETDELGRVTRHSYDSRNLRVQTELPDPDGFGPLRAGMVYTTFDALGNTESIVDHMGRLTTFTFDNINQLLTETSPDPDGDGPLAPPVTRSVYDVMGNVIETYDALNRKTSTKYDALQRPISTTLPDPGVTGPQPVSFIVYDEYGNVDHEIDPAGHRTQYTYDALQRVLTTQMIAADGTQYPITTTQYNVAGLVETETITVPPGAPVEPARVTSYEYDNLDRLTKTTSPQPAGLAASTMTNTYDAIGNLTSEEDSLGNTTEYKFDALNRQTEIVYADPTPGDNSAPTEFKTYDAVGNLIATTDVLGRTTHFVFDELNRVVRKILPHASIVGGQGPISTITYDDAGNIIQETDALARITRYEFDDLDRLVKTISPDPDGAGPLPAPVKTDTFDLVGNLTKTTDHEGREFVYTFDGLNRLHTETQPDPDGTGPRSALVTTHTYDVLGNTRTTTEDTVTGGQARVTEFLYNNLSLVTDEYLPNPLDGTPTGPHTQFGYDLFGNQTQVTDPLGRITTRKFDVLNREVETLTPDPDDLPGGNGPLHAGRTVTTYDVVGNVDTVSDYLTPTEVVTTTNVWDELYRLKSTTVAAPNVPSATTRYEYDLAGNQTAVVDPLLHRTELIYDQRNRLVKTNSPNAVDGLTATGPQSQTVYDMVDNVVATIDPLGRETRYTFDALNRQVTVTGPDPDGSGPELPSLVTTTYDSAGRQHTLTRRITDSTSETTTYSYDALDRVLTETDANNGVTTRTYDDFGNQATFQDPELNVTTFAYDRLNRLVGDSRTVALSLTQQTAAVSPVV